MRLGLRCRARARARPPTAEHEHQVRERAEGRGADLPAARPLLPRQQRPQLLDERRAPGHQAGDLLGGVVVRCEGRPGVSKGRRRARIAALRCSRGPCWALLQEVGGWGRDSAGGRLLAGRRAGRLAGAGRLRGAPACSPHSSTRCMAATAVQVMLGPRPWPLAARDSNSSRTLGTAGSAAGARPVGRLGGKRQPPHLHLAVRSGGSSSGRRQETRASASSSGGGPPSAASLAPAASSACTRRAATSAANSCCGASAAASGPASSASSPSASSAAGSLASALPAPSSWYAALLVASLSTSWAASCSSRGARGGGDGGRDGELLGTRRKLEGLTLRRRGCCSGGGRGAAATPPHPTPHLAGRAQRASLGSRAARPPPPTCMLAGPSRAQCSSVAQHSASTARSWCLNSRSLVRRSTWGG
jgi:hypothetical protein